jgi:hypothetical protein
MLRTSPPPPLAAAKDGAWTASFPPFALLLRVERLMPPESSFELVVRRIFLLRDVDALLLA